MTETRVLTWADIDAASVALAQKVATKGPFTGILAIARGGLTPAGLIAQALDIRRVETLCLRSYDGQKRGALTLVGPRPRGDGAGWLVIDDLVDSGATFALVRALWPRAHFAALYAKPAGRAQTDDFVTEQDQSTWLVFPWERPPQLP